MPDFFSQDSFDAVLFDMDGTILTSIKAAERVWTAWALAHGLDPETFLPTIHGVRSVETIRNLNLAGIDPEAEAAAITRAGSPTSRALRRSPARRIFWRRCRRANGRW